MGLLRGRRRGGALAAAARSTRTRAAGSATCPRSAASTRRCGSASRSPTSPGCTAWTPPPAARAADEWTERLGLAERRGDRVEKLSLGNQQRVQLAAALVSRPEVLILDEPFSGLDPVGVDSLAAALLEQVRDGRAGRLLQPPARPGRAAVRLRRHPRPRPDGRLRHGRRAAPARGRAAAPRRRPRRRPGVGRGTARRPRRLASRPATPCSSSPRPPTTRRCSPRPCGPAGSPTSPGASPRWSSCSARRSPRRTRGRLALSSSAGTGPPGGRPGDLHPAAGQGLPDQLRGAAAARRRRSRSSGGGQQRRVGDDHRRRRRRCAGRPGAAQAGAALGTDVTVRAIADEAAARAAVATGDVDAAVVDPAGRAPRLLVEQAGGPAEGVVQGGASRSCRPSSSWRPPGCTSPRRRTSRSSRSAGRGRPHGGGWWSRRSASSCCTSC